MSIITGIGYQMIAKLQELGERYYQWVMSLPIILSTFFHFWTIIFPIVLLSVSFPIVVVCGPVIIFCYLLFFFVVDMISNRKGSVSRMTQVKSLFTSSSVLLMLAAVCMCWAIDTALSGQSSVQSFLLFNLSFMLFLLAVLLKYAINKQ